MSTDNTTVTTKASHTVCIFHGIYFHKFLAYLQNTTCKYFYPTIYHKFMSYFILMFYKQPILPCMMIVKESPKYRVGFRCAGYIFVRSWQHYPSWWLKPLSRFECYGFNSLLDIFILALRKCGDKAVHVLEIFWYLGGIFQTHMSKLWWMLNSNHIWYQASTVSVFPYFDNNQFPLYVRVFIFFSEIEWGWVQLLRLESFRDGLKQKLCPISPQQRESKAFCLIYVFPKANSSRDIN